MIKVLILHADETIRTQAVKKIEDALSEYEVEVLAYPDEDAVAALRNSEADYIIVGNTSEQYRVKYEDIICIQKVKGTKYVDYVLEEEILRDRRTLEQVMETAGEHGFIMLEKGHAVNMKYVVSLVGNQITLANGQELAVSRTRIQAVRSVLNTYWGVEAK